jgi:hypothetical protein
MRSNLFLGLAATIAGAALFTTNAASQSNPASPASSTNAVAAAHVVEIPQSVFVPASNPREGRNPFFPRSTAAPPPPPTNPNSAPQVDTGAFVLNGITSPPKRTAMINGSTFEVGEEHEIRLPSGSKAMVKCEEIKGDSAVILVNGVRRELRLRLGL